MTIKEAIQWYESKIYVIEILELSDVQREAAQMALDALRAQQQENTIEGMCCDCAYGGPCCDFSENVDCEHRKEDGSCWRPCVEAEKNEPLTLDELKKMSGQPIFLLTGQIVYMDELIGCWEILEEYDAEQDGFWLTRRRRPFLSRNYMKTWAVYRHPPKEAHNV